MSPERDDSVYLNHVLDAIGKIEEYITSLDEASFKKNTMAQDAIIRKIEIIGEAVKRLSPDLTTMYSHIPWSDIAGMRDKLIHDYFGVDIETVWLTAKEDIPHLKSEITKILKDF